MLVWILPVYAQIHWPDLSHLEPEVRKQIKAQQDALMETVKNAGADSTTVSIEYGSMGETYQAYSLLGPARECYVTANRLRKHFRWVYLLAKLDQLEGRSDDAILGFRNSLALALSQTLIILAVASLAGYYISRFAFRGREAFLQGMLVLHAFPAMTLIIPIFLILYWVGLLDTILGVMLVLATIELPFYVFVIKGFFDAVPWDIEMSAMTDGATRRQAFRMVVLPQVRVGLIAVAVFAFIRAWEEYIFVRTMLIENKNWVMSLYLFWVSDDIMGVDYGIVAAVSVFYVLPSLLLYVFCQKYLTQMTIGGIRG